MLHVKPFREKPSFCGPASLKMVLRYFGINKSEDELARMSGHKVSIGVEAEGLLAAAKKLGMKGFIKDFSTVKDIKTYVLNEKIPVIVDWFSQDEGHYSVVVGIKKNKIFLLDPRKGKVRKINIDTFTRVWFDFPGKYIDSKANLDVRRMIVIWK